MQVGALLYLVLMVLFIKLDYVLTVTVDLALNVRYSAETDENWK